MDLANNIRFYRKSLNLTQQQLAKMLNGQKSLISNYENGYSTPDIFMLIKLADIFDVTLDELVGRSAFDEHKRFKEYINKFAVADIPIDDEDEASAIVCRYLLYMEKLNISPEDSLHGLIKIFLTNAIRGEASVLERRSTERKRE